MRVKLIFFAVFMWAISSLALADMADDDYWGTDDEDDADRAFCDALIDVVEYCGTTCLPDEFLDECVAEHPLSKKACLGFTGCADFNECMCQPGADDDSAGDSSDNGDDGSGCGGCGVSNAEAGSFLSAGMMGIGMLALLLSRREGK